MKQAATLFLSVLFLCPSSPAVQEPTARTSVVESTPQWEKVKTLIGEWDGYSMQADQKIPAHISVRMTGDGSALMHWMGAGTPYEMVTMFHMNKTELLATHYCAAHNQPRFRALPSKESNRIDFEFQDGTNIRPGDGFMRLLTVSFVNSDHHNEIWSYDNNGKIEAATFYLTRVKK